MLDSTQSDHFEEHMHQQLLTKHTDQNLECDLLFGPNINAGAVLYWNHSQINTAIVQNKLRASSIFGLALSLPPSAKMHRINAAEEPHEP